SPEFSARCWNTARRQGESTSSGGITEYERDRPVLESPSRRQECPDQNWRRQSNTELPAIKLLTLQRKLSASHDSSTATILSVCSKHPRHLISHCSVQGRWSLRCIPSA